jgi:enoyl-CoA hydratase/carnithine racemase
LDGLKQRSESDYGHRRSNVDKINKMILLMRSCPLPIIAAVEGGAAGAGVGLALACDMIFAAEETFFMAAYVKIGITPDGGMTPFMAEAIPRWLFAQMVFTGDKMPVQRLYQMGVVNEITAKNAAVSSAVKMAERLAKGPAQALAMGKALISSARLSPLGAQLEEEAHIVATALGSKDAREGINAFLEKRAPNFS